MSTVHSELDTGAIARVFGGPLLFAKIVDCVCYHRVTLATRDVVNLALVCRGMLRAIERVRGSVVRDTYTRITIATLQNRQMAKDLVRRACAMVEPLLAYEELDAGEVQIKNIRTRVPATGRGPFLASLILPSKDFTTAQFGAALDVLLPPGSKKAGRFFAALPRSFSDLPLDSAIRNPGELIVHVAFVQGGHVFALRSVVDALFKIGPDGVAAFLMLLPIAFWYFADETGEFGKNNSAPFRAKRGLFQPRAYEVSDAAPHSNKRTDTFLQRASVLAKIAGIKACGPDAKWPLLGGEIWRLYTRERSGAPAPKRRKTGE
jgi:hypothetical protein